MKLTFLIPVYNAGVYLRPCVESCVAWPWPDKEIILIDDGSTDGSGAVCDQLKTECQGKGCQFFVIHQKNGGVSRARNAGLDVATGDWIWMVDADDRVLADGTGGLWDADENGFLAQMKTAQRIVTGFVWDEGGRIDSFGASAGDLPYNLWRCWFRRDIIERNHLRFTVDRKYAEDQEFIWNYALCVDEPISEHTLAIDFPAYYYTMRPGSAMTRPGMKQKQMKDIASVDVSFLGKVVARGKMGRRWVWTELKRMTKTLLVILRR